MRKEIVSWGTLLIILLMIIFDKVTK